MSPTIRDGETVVVTPVIMRELQKGTIVLTESKEGFRLHRLVIADHQQDRFVTRGDCGKENDLPVSREQILGIARAKEVQIGRKVVRAEFKTIHGYVLRGAARAQRIALKWLRPTGKGAGMKMLILLMLAAAAGLPSQAQVAVDGSTSTATTITGPNPVTFNFNHTTAATANRVLIVGVSINLTQGTGTAVSGITYGGTPLTLIGAHNDAGSTRRVELWYLLAPASGTKAIAVTVSNPANTAVGVVAGATTFTGVDQTVPLGTFVSADGAAGTYSQLDVPSVVNGMILDTLAIDGGTAATVSGPQVQQWNLNTGANANQDASGVASSRTGAPSVPVSEVFSGNTNWALGAISVNPSTADIAVSTSVATVQVGSNSTYNITVTNNGPSAANNVTLTDTLAPGVTFVSATPSAGTTCSGTGPLNCTLPSSLASGGTATISVVVNAATSGAYSNTATVTDSGTPPDPNTGNNTYVSVATVQSVACGTTSQAAPGGTLSGTINTYYPGTASVSAGATSISIGAGTGAGQAIAAGNLLLVIQMQDAAINTSNNVAYGNGSTGAGFTSLNSAGNYEFVTATNAVGTGGGTLNIAGSGNGGGLVFNYTAAAATSTKGASTFQVVVVPQYTTATLSSGLTAQAWNGSTGGVLALDASATLSLGGATVAVDGLGFRGAAGMQLTGAGGGSPNDFLAAAPGTYAGNPEAGFDAAKGEGVAGTPLWLELGGTYVNSNSDYPSGGAADGSMARGAPGNGGGGGTDADPANNDQNSGGGGGGNGGAGGFGGDSWSTNLSTGGEGGGAFPATINRISMGGGGGAGTRNNSDGDDQASSGSAGGGIIIIRAYGLSGTGTLTANGAAAYNNTANDGGGGGGAGGTIVVLSANGGEGGLTLQSNGGNGGDAWQANPFTLGKRHGPGGGGGGGAVFVSGAPASISVNGGVNGTTETPGVPYGSTSGGLGVSATNASLTSTSGTQSGAQCTPDMTLGKSHVGNFVRGSTANYTIPVQNVSAYGPSVGVVTVDDTLPPGLTPSSATGTGWSCSVASQTLSCVRSDSLAAGAYYPSITVTANVQQSAPSSVTNTAYVSGGGEVNLVNDSATDVANVISSADLSMAETASPNPVAAGSNITYTQVLTNNGPSAADNATIVAPVPANTTFVSMAAPAGWTCLDPTVGSIGNVVCSTSNLAASAGVNTASFSMMVKVNASVANGTTITGTVTASSSTSDPNASNNTAMASTLVGTTTQAEMVVTNMASPNPVVAGSNITYTQVVTNVGSVTATSPTFTENIPANTTFQSISVPGGTSCTTPPVGGTGTISCTSPNAPAGTSGTVVLVVQVGAGTASGTVITDTATVTSSNQAFGPNSATVTDVVASGTQADLALSTVATPSSVYAGNNITYTQTITNNGPATATNVSFTEATPANTTYQSISTPAGWSCTTPAVGATGTITCTTTNLAASASANMVITMGVASSVGKGPTTATSTVSETGTTDPNLTNNTTTVVTDIADQCALVVTNSGNPNTVLAGNNITYTQTVMNSGPSNCANVQFTEAIPAHTTLSSFTGAAGWSCTTTPSISCTNASLAPGGATTFTFVAAVNGGTASGTIITDTDTATTTTTGSTLNNSATVNTTVGANGTADLSITDSGSPNPASAGGTITFTQVVANNGPSNARSVTVTETVPTNTTFSSLSATGGWTCRGTSPYTCTLFNFAANATATITFVVTVSPTDTAAITDTASIASRFTTDPNTSNNTATATVQVGDSADLSVTITGTPVPVEGGANVTYTQTVTNAGPSTATGVTFVESTPPHTTFVSLTPVPAGWTCTLPAVGTPGTIRCTNPSLATGNTSFPLVLKVTAGTPPGTTITLTGSVSSSTSDPNTSNNTASFTDVVATNTEADLVVTNVATPTSVAAGSNVTYTQSVKNNGPAAAASATFSETTPPNTTFQSLTVPAGWTCTKPAVGGTGTISCTDPSMALNATANFTVVLQVNANTAPGTNISETATATATNIVPNLTTNSATATVVVANANGADVAIVKTASPNPVLQGDTLTYTLAVTNNGPASATNVTVTDSLPSYVTYLSAQTTTGSCSEAGGMVTCLLGTMASGDNETVTILTTAGTPGTVSNTATVTADQSDPNTGNNSSTQTETIAFSTAVQLQYFVAQAGRDQSGAQHVLLIWKTGEEEHNLGFNVYRQVGENEVKINPSLVAGSALQMTGALPQHMGKTYTWIDANALVAGAQYWLEDVSVGGGRQMHGPISVQGNFASAMDAKPMASHTLAQLNQAQAPAISGALSHHVQAMPQLNASQAQLKKQFELAAHPGVKILVNREGWYQVTQPQLVQAGMNPNVDPATLHLYAEAVEQPIQIVGATAGAGGFGPQAAIRFYGTGIDTPYSGNRVYWLNWGDGSGARMSRLPVLTGSNQPPENYPDAVILEQHTTYFGALLTTNGNNFFGSIVTSTPLDQVLDVPHLDRKASFGGQLDVALQGAISGMPHDVSVSLNGTNLGDVNFTGQDVGKLSVSIPEGMLQEGPNTVTLTAQDGDYDVSLVQAIKISYPHRFMADADQLRFTGLPGEEVRIGGFQAQPAAVVDITLPNHPVMLTPEVTLNNGTYEMAVQIPWGNWSDGDSLHTVLAVAGDRIGSVVAVVPNHPSQWHAERTGAPIVMISHENFVGALPPLVKAHRAQGQESKVVLINDLYDEYNFGERSPYVIRQFLQGASQHWRVKPQYLLLNGRASLDPRNYLGFGELDFVPTMIIPASTLMTASDDWFSDFSNTGVPTLATGRLPVSTLDDASLVVGKIAGYETSSSTGSWASQAVMVADTNDASDDFTGYTKNVQAQLPKSLKPTDIFTGNVGVNVARQQIVADINSGALLVNYFGHGSEEQWSGSDIFDDTAANSLTNGSELPVFLIMDCLNGYFQDVYAQPLGVTILLAPTGGGVAVLASSGLNQALPQAAMDQYIVQDAFSMALGDAIVKAKSQITDPGTRETYILFGDPAMRIKGSTKSQPSATR